MADKIPGMFPCAPHKYSTDGSKSASVQEDEWYQHLRDFEHEYTFSQRCPNCRKKRAGKMKGKVPQPYVNLEGVKVSPRCMVIFCDNNDQCKNQYKAKLGVT